MMQSVTSLSATPNRWFAPWYFLVSAMVFGLAGALAYVLVRFLPAPETGNATTFLPAFWASTLLLSVGSVSLQVAVGQVRRERQSTFRRALVAALAAGTLFVGVQSYGMWCLLQSQPTGNVITEVAPFVFVCVGLHAMHLLVALLFVVFVTLKAFDGRYDHEYYWGVLVCACFWHFLGGVWLCILALFAIAT
jgi:cytochrome c oxidase subunit 3